MQLLTSQSPTCLRKAGVSTWAKSSNPGGYRGHKKDHAVGREMTEAQSGYHVKPCNGWSYLQRLQLKRDQGRSWSRIFPNFREHSVVVSNVLGWTEPMDIITLLWNWGEIQFLTWLCCLAPLAQSLARWRSFSVSGKYPPLLSGSALAYCPTPPPQAFCVSSAFICIFCCSMWVK